MQRSPARQFPAMKEEIQAPKKSYIIAGPTASGKSAFAHKLAKLVGGRIINADSVQIYKGIETISASPFAGMEPGADNMIDGVPYSLYSILPLEKITNVADYMALARKEFEEADVPIFVGGSGYYINALISGMSPIPKVSPENREKARKMVQEAPHAARRLIDFEYRDPQRMMRALEVFLETGRSLTEWQELPRRGAIRPTPIRVLVSPPRETIELALRERLPQMLAFGAMDEAREHMGFADRAIGLEELSRFIQGVCTEEEAMEKWATRTDQYAKRQRTWFAHQYDADLRIMHIPTDKDLENVLAL